MSPQPVNAANGKAREGMSEKDSEVNGSGEASAHGGAAAESRTTAAAAASEPASSPAAAAAEASDTLDKVSKYTMYGVNGTTFVGGFILFIFGIVLQVKYTKFLEFMGQSNVNVAVVCIVVGLVTCIIAVLGLYGTYREDYCTLLSFAILLSIVIAIEFSLGVAAFALSQGDQLTAALTAKMKASLAKYNQTSNEAVTKLWDILQTDFDCCGVAMPGDWTLTAWSRRRPIGAAHGVGKTELPESCCKALPFGPYKNDKCTIDDAYTRGCIAALKTSLASNAGVLGAVAVIVAFVQVALVFAACQLKKGLRSPGSKPPFF